MHSPTGSSRSRIARSSDHPTSCSRIAMARTTLSRRTAYCRTTRPASPARRSQWWSARALPPPRTPLSGCYTLHAGSGGVVRQKHELAAILNVPMDRVRVVAGDVGGNFGTRNAFYPEFALAAWASRRLGRPVKWTCDRSEAFLSDYQGRDLLVEAELALDREGHFLALRGQAISNVGAHT